MTPEPGPEPGFSVHMVHVRWDSRTRRDIEVVNGVALPLHPDGPGVWQTTVHSYEQFEGGRAAQFAIHTSKTEPILLENGTVPVPMKQLVSREDGRWWVENGAWSSSHKMFGFESGRSAGLLESRVGDQRCRLRVLPEGFTKEEIEDLFDSFDDALQLILKGNSSVFLAVDWKLDAQLENLLQHFLKASERAIRRPVASLVRGATLVRTERARPGIESARAQARRPGARLVIGWQPLESLDLPENGYLLHCVERIHSRLKWAVRRGAGERRRAAAAAEDIRLRMDAEVGNSTGEEEMQVRIDPERYMRALRREHTRLRTFFAKCPPLSGSSKCDWTFTVKKRAGPQFYVNVGGRELILVFPTTWGVTERQLRPTGAYRLKASVQPTTMTSYQAEYGAEEAWRVCEVLEISDLRLERLAAVPPLNIPVPSDEQDQFRTYLRTLRREATVEEGHAEAASAITTRLRVLEGKAGDLLRRLAKAEVKPRRVLPQSIVFALNRDYRTVARLFPEIAALWNLGGEDRYCWDGNQRRGVTRASEIYERWCLLEILNTLTERFRFSKPAESDWVERLAAAVQVDRRERDRTILTLRNDDWGVVCTLEYEKRITNPQKEGALYPDIVLGIVVDHVSEPDRAGTCRFLIDGKFRPFGVTACMERLSEVLNEASAKYAAVGKGTYLLHPSPGAITEPVARSPWADSSTYGGSEVFEWEQEPPQHAHGAVLLRPGRTRDHLRRLLVMLFHRAGFYSFCPGCGGKVAFKERETTAGNRKYSSECTDPGCDMHTTPLVVTLCHQCQERLVKLGPHWTYHDFAYQKPGYNIACPKCGASA